VQLDGRVAVVTGGGSGIGEGLCRAFAERGMSVVVSDISLESAERVASDIGGVPVRTDVASSQSVAELADLCFERFGEVHVLCNNAGVAPVEPLPLLTADDWRWGLDVNLDGIVHGLLAFLPRMRAQAGPGHVVNTASIAGVTALPRHAAYCASKHGAVALTESVRREGAGYGVSASVLCPGVVKSGILHSGRNRPSGDRGARHGLAHRAVHNLVSRYIMSRALDPVDVGRFVADGVERGDLYLFSHRDDTYRALVDKRLRPVERALLA
jgi:NAD(P)-dependent dehydrogenase (short-subunit alcohol dehydrogenase family)